MTYYFIVVGIAVAGLLAVAILLIKEKKQSSETIDTLSSDMSGGEMGSDFQPIPGESELFGKPKKQGLFSKLAAGKKQDDPFKNQDAFSQAEPKSKSIIGSILGKIKSGKKKDNLISASSHFDLQEKSTENKSIVGKILSKFKKDKNQDFQQDDIPQPTPFPSLKETLSLNTSKMGTASITTSFKKEPSPFLKKQPAPEKEPFPVGEPLTEEEQQKLDEEINASLALSDVKEKMGNLDKLLQEKSAALEKSEKSLEHEIKNRKEFNKVKDLLEKELKDVKDNTKKIQQELNEANQEIDNYKKKIAQLEEKATKLEKELAEKEKINTPAATADDQKQKETPPDIKQEELPPAADHVIIEKKDEKKPNTSENLESLIESPPEKKPEIFSVSNPQKQQEELNIHEENTAPPADETNDEKPEFLSLRPDVVNTKDTQNPLPEKPENKEKPPEDTNKKD